MTRTKVAVIGSGNIGTDLMIRVLRLSDHLEMGAMVGIDPDSRLRRAQCLGVPTTAHGVRGLVDMPEFDDTAVVFDATSASAHHENARLLAPLGKKLVDLTPAAIGPFVVPTVNLHEHLDSPNVNMVTCGGGNTRRRAVAPPRRRSTPTISPRSRRIGGPGHPPTSTSSPRPPPKLEVSARTATSLSTPTPLLTPHPIHPPPSIVAR